MLSGQVGTKTTSPAGDISSTFSAGLASASAGTAVAATLCNTVAAAVGNETQLTFSPAGNYSATGAVGVVIESIATANSALKFYTYNAGLLEAARIDSGGNYIPKNAAKGINFTANTPLAGMTSQLLNWYEEGTYTPTVAATTGSITSYTVSAVYTRVGRLVTFTANVTITNAGLAAGALTITLPYTAGGYAFNGSGRENALTGYMLQAYIAAGGTLVNVVKYDNTTAIVTNAQLRVTITYSV